MVTPQSRQFNLRLEAFSVVREFIEQFCAGAGIPQRSRENLILIIDELSENTVRHGYPAANESAILRSSKLRARSGVRRQPPSICSTNMMPVS